MCSFGSPLYLSDPRIPRVVLGAPPMLLGGAAPLVGGGFAVFPGAAPPMVVLGGPSPTTFGSGAGSYPRTSGYSCGGRCYGCCGKSYCTASHGLSCCDSCRPMNPSDFGCGGRAPRHCIGCCGRAAVLGSDACLRTAHTRDRCSECSPPTTYGHVYVAAPTHGRVYVDPTPPASRMAGESMVFHSTSCIGCCASVGHTRLPICLESVHTTEACSKCRRR
jgi:hypothetical protein